MSTEDVYWGRLRGGREVKSFKGDAKDVHVGMESSAVKGFVEVKDWWDSAAVWSGIIVRLSVAFISPGEEAKR